VQGDPRAASGGSPVRCSLRNRDRFGSVRLDPLPTFALVTSWGSTLGLYDLAGTEAEKGARSPVGPGSLTGAWSSCSTCPARKI
jgi:hypothetical protein